MPRADRCIIKQRRQREVRQKTCKERMAMGMRLMRREVMTMGW
jgi:hypothetical protein